MTRDQALGAIDASFDSRVDHLGDVFVEGLIEGEPIAELTARFDRGFAIVCETHDRLKAAVEAHFASS